MRRRPITDLYTLAVQTCKLSRASALSSTMCPVLKHHNTCSVLSHLHVSLPTSVIDLAVCSQVYYRTAMKATKKHCTRLLNPNEQPTANKCDKIVFHGCLAPRVFSKTLSWINVYRHTLTRKSVQGGLSQRVVINAHAMQTVFGNALAARSEKRTQ